MSKVKLVSITQPVIDGIKNAEDLIVYCARVSNPSNQMNFDTSQRLLKYCIEHQHWSVFEQADMTVEIVTSRGISPQILRHKTASFQEFSQRYAEVQDFEKIELRKQGKTNRQVGDEVFNPVYRYEVCGGGTSGEYDRAISANEEVDNYIRAGKKLYENLVGLGVARECARFVLPISAQTTLYMKNNVRNWIFYIQLRTQDDTQKEHRQIALQIKEIFRQQFPIISEVLWG